ncbi:MAG: hypothetical protein M1511_12320, partial [Deltaproteobacteria bacterium]|nr:hypothetical protein [Deltaproteobacteria bacterium]
MRLDKIVIATRNRGKFLEIKKLLAETNITVMSIDDFDDVPEVDEDGETFEDNALKKAHFVASTLGIAALADDSGLCVDFIQESMDYGFSRVARLTDYLSKAKYPFIDVV